VASRKADALFSFVAVKSAAAGLCAGAKVGSDRFRSMCRWNLVRVLAGLSSALLVGACSVAQAEDACSDEGIKDFFVQGGQQVLEDSHLKITSLSHDEVVAQSNVALTCRYLMELSDHSKRWVRFTYSLDDAGQAAIDYEEEAKSTSR